MCNARIWAHFLNVVSEIRLSLGPNVNYKAPNNVETDLKYVIVI